jgi:hypothetical protein
MPRGPEGQTCRGGVLLVTFLPLLEDKFIRNEFVLQSRPDKFDRIKFEQPKAGPQGVTHGWVA